MPFQNVSADMENVGLRKVHGNVAIRMRRTVVLQFESRAVKLESAVGDEDLVRNATRTKRKKILVPVLDALNLLTGTCVCSPGR